MIDANNPSYYRAHQYRNQFDLPNSAFKNRDLQSFTSSIPQGKQYFQKSNKKHFANKFNRSQIQQDKVLYQYPEQQVKNSRIAFQPSYFRSLNVDDIQGTRPNTLISKAIKNRQKAANLMKNHQESYQWQNKSTIGAENYLINSRKIQKHYINESYSHNKPFIYKQTQAVNKFKKSKSILQSSSANVLNNFVSQEKNYQPVVNSKNINRKDQEKNIIQNYSNNFHYRGIPKIVKNNIENFQTLQSDEEQTLQKEIKKKPLKQQKIHQMENQLLSNLHFKSNNYQNQELYKKNKTDRDMPFLNYKSTENKPYQNQKNTIDFNHYNLQRKEQNQQQNVKIRNQTNQSQLDSLSPSRLHINQYQLQKPYNIRTQTQNSTQLMNTNITPKINKSNIRKFNPTFLSFQSQTITRHYK